MRWPEVEDTEVMAVGLLALAICRALQPQGISSVICLGAFPVKCAANVIVREYVSLPNANALTKCKGDSSELHISSNC